MRRRRYDYHVYLALDFCERAADLDLSDGAYRLHIAGLQVIADQKGVNRIPDRRLRRLMPRYRMNYLSELVNAGWWHSLGEDAWSIDMGGERSLHRSTRGKALWMVRRSMESRKAIPPDLRQAVYERDGHLCLQCKSSENLTLDHIYPYSLGGEDTLENLRTLCRFCNSRKGARV